MLLWHAGVGAALIYVSLGRRRVDYRYVLLGAVLPDVIDALAGALGVDTVAGRGPAHALLSPVVLAIAIVLAFSTERRLAVFGLAVGWLTHLVADGMWASPQTFLWPAFGWEFVVEVGEPYSWELFTDPAGHLSTWGAELVGLALLGWLWVAHRLGEGDRARLWLKDGYLRP